jgi:hypothetical protein
MKYQVIAVLTAMAVIGACARRDGRQEDQLPVSQQPVEVKEPLRTPPPPPPRDIYFGEGDCAPRLGRGLVGTCINGQSCNGFGFKYTSDRWECGCFEQRGACGEGMACSAREKKCVKVEVADIIRPNPK